MGLQDDLNAYLKPPEAAAPAPGSAPAPLVGEGGGPSLKSSLDNYLSGKDVAPAPVAPAPATTPEPQPERQPSPMTGYRELPAALTGRPAPAATPAPAEVAPPAPAAPTPQPQAEVQPPAPGGQPEEKGLTRRAFEEVGRFAATANKPVLDTVHGFARVLEEALDLPARGARALQGDTTTDAPHILTAATEKAREIFAPEDLQNDAHPVTKFLGNLLGGLESYMIPGKALGAAGVTLPNANLFQKFGSNLLTFSTTDVSTAVGNGGGLKEARDALVKSIPTAALFTVAQALPFDKVSKNPWLTKALESTATGGAFAGSHALQGETDPAALAVSFLTGFGLHAVTSGMPGKQGMSPEQLEARRQGAIKDAQDNYFNQFTIDWRKENNVSDEQWKPVKEILDQVEAGKPTPEAQKEAIFGNRFAENLPKADAIRALVPEVGSHERAERFYDLYEKGDAATALKEFPELSSFATEQQKAAAITPAEREAAAQTQPMGTAGSATMNVKQPAPEAAEATPGSPLPGTAVSGGLAADDYVKLRKIVKKVELAGDPNAAKQLNDLIVANPELATMFNIKDTQDWSRRGPILDKMADLMQRVEKDGDPAAAKELHDYVTANPETLKDFPRWPTGGANTSSVDMVSKGQPAVNPAGRQNEKTGALPPEEPAAAPRFAEPAKTEPPSGGQALAGGQTVSVAVTPSEEAKPAKAQRSPFGGVVAQPMGTGVERPGEALDASKGAVGAKEPWEMTQLQWAGALDDYAKSHGKVVANEKEGFFLEKEHKKAVQEALAAGKPVPPEVLADYPGLAAISEPAKPTLPAQPMSTSGATSETPAKGTGEAEKGAVNAPGALEGGKELPEDFPGAMKQITGEAKKIQEQFLKEKGLSWDQVRSWPIEEQTKLQAEYSNWRTAEPWKMTANEHNIEGKKLYEELGNEGFVNSDFRTFSEGASHEIHQEAKELFPNNSARQAHYAAVKRALAEGKPVPSSVLADYPDLAAKYGKSTPTQPLAFSEIAPSAASGEVAPETRTAPDLPGVLPKKKGKLPQNPVPQTPEEFSQAYGTTKGVQPEAAKPTEQGLFEGGEMGKPGGGRLFKVQQETGRRLYELQDKTVEHKLPIKDGNASYFEEAAGDIYRELSQYADKGYISEKISKLKDWFKLNDGDIQQTLRNKEGMNLEKLQEYKKNLTNLRKETESSNFERKNEMLQTIDVMEGIVKWLDNPKDLSQKNIVTLQIRNLERSLVGVERPTYRTAEGSGAEELSKEQVQTAFPGAKITESNAMRGLYEGFQVDLPNGKRIIVRKNEFIMVDPKNLEAGYGQKELGPGEYIAGEARRIDRGAMITLAKGEGVGTFSHETFHVAMDMVLTDKEKAAVLKKYGDEESAARAFETWDPKAKPDTFFGKIVDFFRQAYRALFPDAEIVFGKVKEGEIWGREARLPEALAPRGYSVKDTVTERAKEEKEAIKAWHGRVSETLGKLFNAPRLSEAALKTHQSIAKSQAEADLEIKRMAREFLDYAGKMGPIEGEATQEFCRLYESGQPFPADYDPTFRAFGEYFRREEQRQMQIMKDLGKAPKELANYLDHLWERDDQLIAVQNAIMTGRSMQGPNYFFNARSIPDIPTGIAMGLKPKFPTLPEMAMAGRAARERFIAAQKRINDLETNKYQKVVKNLDNLPEGWRQMPGGYGEVWARVERRAGQMIPLAADENVMPLGGGPDRMGYEDVPGFKGWTRVGYRIAPDYVVTQFENFLGQGLQGGDIYKLYAGTIDGIRTFQMALSWFHLTFESLNTMATQAGRGMMDSIGGLFTGDFPRMGQGLKALGTSPFAPVTDIRLGRKASNLLMDPEAAKNDPQAQHTLAIARTLVGGGQRIQAETKLSKIMGTYFREAWDETKGLHGIRAANKIMRSLTAPIMDYVVPFAKLGSSMRTYMGEVERWGREHPGETLSNEESLRIAYETRETSDNVFGQMAMDNVGMNATVKSLLSAVIQFPTWNIGTVKVGTRAVSGVSDLLLKAKDLIQGKEVRKLDIKDRQALQYTAGLLFTVGLVGGLMHYAFTGNRPEELADFYFPQTGQLNPNGSPERVQLPSYLKDALGITKHPLQTVGAKMAAPIHIITDLLQNRDYWGTQIYDPDSWWGSKGLDMMKYVGKSATPFVMQSYQHGAQETPSRAVASLLGVRPVPREIANTPAQNEIDKYNQLMRAATTTRESKEKKDLKANLMSMAREQDTAGFEEAAGQAVSEGKITRQQVQEIIKESQQPPAMSRFTRLPLEWKLKTWDKASDYEKEQWQPYFLKAIKSEKLENLIKLRDPVVAALQDLGLNEAADAVQNLTMPEKGKEFDLTGLGITKPAPEMSGMEAVDAALSSGLEEKLTKIGLTPEKKSSGLRLPSLNTREKKSRMEF